VAGTIHVLAKPLQRDYAGEIARHAQFSKDRRTLRMPACRDMSCGRGTWRCAISIRRVASGILAERRGNDQRKAERCERRVKVKTQGAEAPIANVVRRQCGNGQCSQPHYSKALPC